nr:putative ribonuclease H-like domain-containing protein [Tanacetum cinerariifolium]
MFDEYLEPPRTERPGSPAQAVQAPITSAGTPLSTTIDQDASSLHISPLSSALQSHSLPPGVVAKPHFMEDHNVAPVDNNPLVNVFAPELYSEASSSRDISSTESPYKYILVIVDDYSRFTWVKFLRSKDETSDVVIKFITQIQVSLNKTVRYLRTDNGTKFINHTKIEYYERIGIFHQKTVPRTPQQNGVVERRNHTLVEAARTMLIFSKASMFLWAETMATACYTENRSLIHTRHHKTSYELVHNKKPDLTFFRVFDKLRPCTKFGSCNSLCTPTNKELEMFNEYLEPPRAERPGSPAQAVQAPVTSAGTPLSTTIDQDAPSLNILPSSSALQSYSLPPDVVAEPHFIEDHNVAPVDNNPFVNVFAPEPHFEASSSGDISSTESPHVSQSLHHLNK